MQAAQRQLLERERSPGIPGHREASVLLEAGLVLTGSPEVLLDVSTLAQHGPQTVSL